MTAIILRRRKLGRTSAREIAGFSRTGIRHIRNDQPFPAGTDLVFRWGCTSDVPTRNVVNTAEAIHRVANKSAFRQTLEQIQPHWPAWTNARDVRFPAVVRPAAHHQGRKLFVAGEEHGLNVAIRHCGHGWYAAPLINKTAEYRVTIVQGRVCWVASKTPADRNTVAWNVAQGGTFNNVRWDDWPLKACKVAIQAFELSGLDFGAVDIMEDADGQVYVLEINSAPSQTSPYRQECMAKCFDWIVQHGKATIPLIEAKGGYLKFIHPALTDKAKLRG